MHHREKERNLAAARGLQLSRSIGILVISGAFASAVHAQSSVTLYGSLDAGLRNVVNGTKAGGGAVSMASNGTYNSNRWGMAGVEDLGGGLRALFDLESGFMVGTGANDNTNGIEFHRTSTIGLAGAFGTVNIGHQFTLQHYLIDDYEPMAFKYLAVTEATAIADGNTGRDDNDIYYFGAFGPTVIRAEYALGGVAGSVTDGSTRGVGFNYVSHAIKFGFGYTHKANQIVTGTGPFLGDNQYTAGAAYVIGNLSLMGGYSLNLQDAPALDNGAIRNQYLWGGGRYRINAEFEVSAAYYDNRNITAGVSGRKDVSILGVTYSLSKSTLLYADVDYTKFTGGYITNLTLNPSGHPSQTGISIGMNHWF